MGKAYLSLGSNIDAGKQPASRAARVARALRRRCRSRRSTAPRAVGFDGPDFLNAAAVIDTDLDADALNDWLHALEDAHGRDRSGPRFGDRPLDIDIVFYDDLVHRGAGQPRIPRPELKHAFVLKPLADIAPDVRRSGLAATRWPSSGHSHRSGTRRFGRRRRRRAERAHPCSCAQGDFRQLAARTACMPHARHPQGNDACSTSFRAAGSW